MKRKYAKGLAIALSASIIMGAVGCGSNVSVVTSNKNRSM